MFCPYLPCTMRFLFMFHGQTRCNPCSAPCVSRRVLIVGLGKQGLRSHCVIPEGTCRSVATLRLHARIYASLHMYALLTFASGHMPL
jgi:hypothetical protein